ncbi:neprilysin-1-like isoform X2 [Amblyomma americanum]
MKFPELFIFYVFAIAICWATYQDERLLGNHKVKRVVCNSEVCQQRGLLEAIKNTTRARSLTEKLGIAYRTCKSSSTHTSKDKGLKIIKKLLAKSGLGLWPLIGNATRHPFKNSVEVLNMTGGLSLILSFVVVKDLSEAKSKRVQLEQSTALRDDDAKKPESNESNDTMAESIDDLKSIVLIFTPNSTDEELACFAREQLAFRTALANLVQPLAERRNISRNLAKRTIKEVEADLAGFPLLELLNKEFNKGNVTLNYNDKILVNAVDYINNTLKFITETDPVRVYNHIGAKAAEKLAAFTWIPEGTPPDSNKNDSEIVEDDDVTAACLLALKAYVPELLGRLYLQHKFPDKTKAEVRAMLSDVGRTYYRTLRNVPWMDIVTRRRAVHKLWKMAPYVGYSGFNLSDDALNKHFDHVGEITSNDSFAEIILKFDENSALKMYASLRDDGPLWLPQGGPEVNAFNLIAFNEIVISAGILRGVYFQPGLPSFINLGAIGMVMGHEISHAYDDQGFEYDAVGRLVNWWTNYTREEYERKRDCFVKQYGSIVDPVVNMSLNGVATLGENIADNAGIRAAYYTLQSVVPDFEEVTLPGLGNFNRDQLFFISYALAWCENSQPSYTVEKITEHVHSPNKYRVNIPLKNLEQFSATFSCKEGSGMRLPHAERCLLW